MKRVVLKNEYFDEIENTNKIVASIQIMRILKTIRYNHVLLDKVANDAELRANIKFYVLWNLCSTLYEGIKTFSKMGLQSSKLKCYKSNHKKFEYIKKESSDRNSLTNQLLKSIRDKLISHFDKDVILENLRALVSNAKKENEEVVFFSGKTLSVGDCVYDLADSIDYYYILGQIESREKTAFNKIKTIMRDVIKLSKSFCEVLEIVAGELMEQYSVRLEDGN